MNLRSDGLHFSAKHWIIVTALLTGCGSVPTIVDAPYDEDMIRNAPAYIWAYPRNDRVDLDQYASNDFHFELPDFPESDPQPEDSQVCWAYCASQVLQYTGIEVSPDELVQKLRDRRKGGDVSRGDAGTVLDMMRPLLAPGTFVGIYTANPMALAQDITYDSPVILALGPDEDGEIGHAVVLVGIRFSFYGNAVLPSEVDIYDPLTGSIDNHEAADIFKRVKWCIHFRDFRRF